MMRCKTRKRPFRDELAAKIALSERIARDKGETRTYKCEFCPAWHLTSQPLKTERVIPLSN